MEQKGQIDEAEQLPETFAVEPRYGVVSVADFIGPIQIATEMTYFSPQFRYAQYEDGGGNGETGAGRCRFGNGDAEFAGEEAAQADDYAAHNGAGKIKKRLFHLFFPNGDGAYVCLCPDYTVRRCPVSKKNLTYPPTSPAGRAAEAAGRGMERSGRGLSAAGLNAAGAGTGLCCFRRCAGQVATGKGRGKFFVANLFFFVKMRKSVIKGAVIMPRKMSRRKKLARVVKRKLAKPMLYALGLSLLLYLAVSNVVLQRRLTRDQLPHFVITKISSAFDETEFLHMLLTVQEIMRLPQAAAELKAFANGPYPGDCPPYLRRQLYRMNWEPQAFLVRMKKMMEMYAVYDRVSRLDDTIAFLAKEIDEQRFPPEMDVQVQALQKERDGIIGKEITPAEFEFAKEYGGLLVRLQNI